MQVKQIGTISLPVYAVSGELDFTGKTNDEAAGVYTYPDERPRVILPDGASEANGWQSCREWPIKRMTRAEEALASKALSEKIEELLSKADVDDLVKLRGSGLI